MDRLQNRLAQNQASLPLPTPNYNGTDFRQALSVLGEEQVHSDLPTGACADHVIYTDLFYQRGSNQQLIQYCLVRNNPVIPISEHRSLIKHFVGCLNKVTHRLLKYTTKLEPLDL